MQKNAIVVLALGFFMGLGLASCATSDPSRTIASDSQSKFVGAKAENEVPVRECYTGEERNEQGECVRVQTIERPARRGGR